MEKPMETNREKLMNIIKHIKKKNGKNEKNMEKTKKS